MTLESKIKKILNGFNCDFEVKDNIVFLKGDVKNYADWINLGLIIGKINGVEGVVNNIKWNGGQDNAYIQRMKKRKQIFEQQKEKLVGEFDIVIVGGGVIGCFIARQLSKYQNSILVLEKEPDVGLGASRANNGMIHPGISPEYNTLKRDLNVKGNASYDKICRDLDVSFKRVGSLILVTSRTLEKYKKYIPGFVYRFLLRGVLPLIAKKRGTKNGVRDIKIVKGKKIFEMEPWVTKNALAAIYIPSTGILDSYDLTIALAENAVANGVDIRYNIEVVGFKKNGQKITGIVTTKGAFDCKMVINAAGVFADEIADLAGSREFTIHPRKGVELLFNKNVEPGINHCLAELIIPTPKTSKGGGINPVIHGNIIWGPTAVEIQSKSDTSVSRDEICFMLDKYSSVVNDDFPKKKMIRYFSGIRAPTFTEDFIIRPAKWVENLIHVAGIQSPGLASAPAIADYVVLLVKKKGFANNKKNVFNPIRQSISSVANMDLEELQKKIEKDSSWGNIVCTCEIVSEAEIVEAIRRGARSVDAVKRRTRAGMGSCQYSYCRLRIARILSRELKIPLDEVIKESAESKLYNGVVRGETR